MSHPIPVSLEPRTLSVFVLCSLAKESLSKGGIIFADERQAKPCNTARLDRFA